MENPALPMIVVVPEHVQTANAQIVKKMDLSVLITHNVVMDIAINQEIGRTGNVKHALHPVFQIQIVVEMVVMMEHTGIIIAL